MMVNMNASIACSRFCQSLVAVGLGATLLLATACIRPEALSTPLALTSSAPGTGDEVLVEWVGNALVVDLHSASGIGKAAITMTTALPLTATLRLHLTGLEHLQVSNGVTTLVAQVSSQADHAILQSVAQAPAPVSAAQAIASEHPLWFPITPPTPAQPYFTVILPPAFLAETDRILTLEWVDFYR